MVVKLPDMSELTSQLETLLLGSVTATVTVEPKEKPEP